MISRTEPLKIAITHTRYSYTGGIEKYIHSLVERLLELGHEVHYVASRWEEREHPRLHFHKVPLTRFPPSRRVLSFNEGCNRVLESHDFDLVHGFTKTDQQDVYTDGSGCLDEYLEATMFDRPNWWRRLYRQTPHQRAIAEMERRRFQKDAILHIVPMAEFVKDQILAHYPVDPSRIEVLYNGVELEHFHPNNRDSLGADFRREHDIAANRRVLLFVGNDWLRKGLDTTLEAIAAAQQKLEAKPVLLVAGHDNHPQRFRQQAEKLDVDVVWLGPVREIRVAFAAADLFVFPSRYDVFGNVGLEALASGVPSLLSSKAGVGELLTKHPGPGGAVLQDPADSRELADRIVEFLNQDLAPHREAARTIAEQYSWDQHFERLLDIYDQVVKEKRAERARLSPS